MRKSKAKLDQLEKRQAAATAPARQMIASQDRDNPALFNHGDKQYTSDELAALSADGWTIIRIVWQHAPAIPGEQ